MQEDVIFRYKNGRIIPIKINKEQTSNDYMNDKIRENTKYTKKDIKPMYAYDRKQYTIGYELNGIYLLKNNGFGIKPDYEYGWVINETSNHIPERHYLGEGEMQEYYAKDKYAYFKTFNEAREKLLELANKKQK